MKCSNCGRDIPNDSIYCEFCGVQVKFSDTLHKKSKRTLWIILSVVLAVVIAVVAFAIIQEQQERQAVIAWEQQQAAQKQQELEQQLEAERQAKLEAERKAELARQEAERQAELVRHGYVDLGLPSGTYWKNANEGGDYTRYTYDEAVRKFGNKLPTKQQFEELNNKSTWTWTGSGYKVIGPNGNSIYLPAAGYRDCSGDVHIVGTYGSFWSSTPIDSNYAWNLDFDSDEVGMYYPNRCSGLSVRLVQ